MAKKKNANSAARRPKKKKRPEPSVAKVPRPGQEVSAEATGVDATSYLDETERGSLFKSYQEKPLENLIVIDWSTGPDQFPVRTFRDPAISLWQAAIHRVLMREAAAEGTELPGTGLDATASHPLMIATNAAAQATLDVLEAAEELLPPTDVIWVTAPDPSLPVPLPTHGAISSIQPTLTAYAGGSSYADKQSVPQLHPEFHLSSSLSHLSKRIPEKVNSRLCGCACRWLHWARARYFKWNKGEADSILKGIKYTKCDERWFTESAKEYAHELANVREQLYLPPGQHNGVVVFDDETTLSLCCDTSNFTFNECDVKLEDKTTVAIIGDWGTGTPEAEALLKQVAGHEPQVLIHLGDIYYAGLADQMLDNFYKVCKRVFNSMPRILTLSGNHDRYSRGGQGYYCLLQKLRQPNSYFCLRNKCWQFLGMDTGYYDSHFSFAPTGLCDSEITWHRDKIEKSGECRTILLSHHQYFSFRGVGNHSSQSGEEHPADAPEPLGKLLGKLAPLTAVNPHLKTAFGPYLHKVDWWFWGHEHNLLIFKEYAGLKRGRCIGASAIPVLVGGDDNKNHPKLEGPLPVTEDRTSLGSTNGVYHHAYAIMKLNGPEATADYYQYNPVSYQSERLHTETVPPRA